MREVKRIIIHHTATPGSTTVESIRRYHTQVLHWRDIGYHFLIDGKGRLRLGRPEHIIGAHVKGHNRDSIGVAVIGNTMYNDITSYQSDVLRVLLEDLFCRYPGVEAVTHQELAETWCPGKYLQSWVDEWRQGE